jgi:hypothetical protein
MSFSASVGVQNDKLSFERHKPERVFMDYERYPPNFFLLCILALASWWKITKGHFLIHNSGTEPLFVWNIGDISPEL